MGKSDRVEVFLPAVGELSSFQYHDLNGKILNYSRTLPKPLSRFVETFCFDRITGSDGSIMVLGDIPIRTSGPQLLFLQNALLIQRESSTFSNVGLNVQRRLLSKNLKWVDVVVVQSNLMAELFSERFPNFRGKLISECHPAPSWLTRSGLKRTARYSKSKNAKLRLFFPASHYPHKNHGIFADFSNHDLRSVEKIVLTVSDDQEIFESKASFECLGTLDIPSVLDQYSKADALIFPSLNESMGLPLLEAMSINLPILCSDLPYSRSLCGDYPIYFDPTDKNSIREAIYELGVRFQNDWWPTDADVPEFANRSWAKFANVLVENFKTPSISKN